MSDAPSPRRTWKSIFEEAATWLSFLSLPAGLLLTWFGYKTDDRALGWLLFPLAGFIWLRYQLKLAKQYRTGKRLGEEGRVYPDWLWTLVTGVLSHQSQALPELPPLMVVVPPGREADAGKMDEMFNPAKNLLFHCIPEFEKGWLDESHGHTLDGEPQPLSALAMKLDNCAALVLLDDGNWGRYGHTMEVIRQWSIRHSVRPIMSVQLSGGGLTYNFCSLTQVTEHNQAMLGRLLAQTANRGAAWHRQANLVGRLASVLVVVSVVTLTLGFGLWSRYATLSRADRIDPIEQGLVARALATYRDNPQAPHDARFRSLLNTHAHQLKAALTRSSGLSEASSLVVIMFAVVPDDPKESTLRVEEVTATREPVTVPFRLDPQDADIRGIVTCAVDRRAFVLWTGKVWGKHSETSDIQAWDLQGEPVGVYKSDTRKIEINGRFCSYQPAEEDPRKRMLCAPVGLADDSAGRPTGAICVSSKDSSGFLTEPWARNMISRYGNALSFSYWEAALVTPMPSPSPAAPATPTGKGAR